VQHAASAPFPRHFDGKRFFNPDAPQARGFLDALRWKLTSRPEPSLRFVSDVQPSNPPSSVESNDLRVTLVNHSTVLLQQSGINILTDPIWSERASPFTWIGPRRRRAPGVRWEDLPPIHLVLLSHNHYDHLDLATCAVWPIVDHASSSSRSESPAYSAPPASARSMSWTGASRKASSTACRLCIFRPGLYSIAIGLFGADM
jgi:Predicted Zn-dependent hydrolases of the beta-lactamase fold